MGRMRLSKAFKTARESKDRYRLFTAASRFGKIPYYIAQETILNMASNPDYRYLIVRKTLTNLAIDAFQTEDFT